MLTESDKAKTPGELLLQVLIRFLRHSKVVGWPGADGLTEDDIVNCYPQGIAAGEVPDWHEVQERFPSLVGELQALRVAKGWLGTCSNRDRKQGSSCEAALPSRHPNEPEPSVSDTDQCRLSRWLVAFVSGSDWYPVGEYIALDAAAAINRAVDVFGPGAAYRAEEIPWDAAPLLKPPWRSPKMDV